MEDEKDEGVRLGKRSLEGKRKQEGSKQTFFRFKEKRRESGHYMAKQRAG